MLKIIDDLNKLKNEHDSIYINKIKNDLINGNLNQEKIIDYSNDVKNDIYNIKLRNFLSGTLAYISENFEEFTCHDCGKILTLSEVNQNFNICNVCFENK